MSPSNNPVPSPEATVATPVAAGADTSSEPQKRRADALSVGALLAAAPGVGFVLSWVHEFAYVYWFGVPPSLVAPQLSDVLVATALLLGVTLIVFTLVEIYSSLRPPGKEFGVIETRLAVLLVVTLAVIAGEFVFEALIWRIAFFGLWAWAGFTFFVPMTRSNGTYRERLVAKTRASSSRRSLVSAFRERLGVSYMLIAVAGMSAFWLSTMSGALEATWQTTYIVTTSGPSELVVKIYGDTVILADYDIATHQIRRRYHIQKLGNQPLNMEERNLGHLSLEGS